MTTTTTPRKLFEIGEDLLAIQQMLDDCTNPAEFDSSVTMWMEALGNEQGEKLDRYINLVRKLESQKAAAKAEAERYLHAEKMRAGHIQYLKDHIKRHMEATRQLRIETASGRIIRIQKNGGKAPVQIDDVEPSKLEARFQRMSVSVDGEAVRAALEDGEELAFARIMESGTHVRIS